MTQSYPSGSSRGEEERPRFGARIEPSSASGAGGTAGAGGGAGTPSAGYGAGTYGAGGYGSQVPVCPLHPDKVAYVRCQRCGRPVCPQCQVASEVGVRCVDCAQAAQQARAAARPRTVMGAVAGAGTRLTTILIAACVVVYGVQMVMPSLEVELGFWPLAALVQPWRFLTTAFLHGSFMHLAFNMWALWVCGAALEPVLGRWRFATLYFLSALGGSVAVYLYAALTGSWMGLTVGASGAVFGLFAAIFVIQRKLGRDTTQILILLAINLGISFMGSGISWQGHLGGLLTGLAVAAVMAWAPRERRTPVTVAGCVGIGVVLLAIVAGIALTVAPSVTV